LKEQLRVVQNENSQLREEVEFLRVALQRTGDSSSSNLYPAKSSRFAEDSLHAAGFILMVMWITCAIITQVTPHPNEVRRFNLALPSSTQVTSASQGSSNQAGFSSEMNSQNHQQISQLAQAQENAPDKQSPKSESQ